MRFLALLLLLVASPAFAQDSPLVGNAKAQSDLVKRGDYLVNGILNCGLCHTPRGAGGVFDQSKQFSGGWRTYDEPHFQGKGSNITPDPNTGIGKWSADDIKRSLQTGVRPNGVPIAMMPFGFYRVLLPADLDAVAAYMKSVPPVHNAVAPPVYKATMPDAIIPPGAEKAMSPDDMSDPVKRGLYLATLGFCMGCHTPAVNSRPDFKRMGAGGRSFTGPWGETISSNITPNKIRGIGAWTDKEIIRAVAAGVSKDGRTLKPPMSYDIYAKMTDADLTAVVAYLRTVPAQE